MTDINNLPSRVEEGAVVKDGKVVEKNYAYFNKKAYCNRHPNFAINKIENIRLVPFKHTLKDGTVEMGRMCPKCRVVTMVDQKSYL